MKFRLLAGCHIGPDPVLKGPDGMPADKRYVKDDIIDSDLDLCACFNAKRYNPQGICIGYDLDTPPKFERLDASLQAVGGAAPVDPFERQAGETTVAFKARLKEMTQRAQVATERATATEKTLEKSLESMSTQELLQLAADEEIEVGHAKKRDDILKIVREVLRAAPTLVVGGK